jgi:hypothetical protein
MRVFKNTTALLATTLLAFVAQAQTSPIDKNYETNKTAELSTIKLQLATQPGSTAVQELNEAEYILRRLKETKGAEDRRRIAAELELTVSRLKIAANGGASSR